MKEFLQRWVITTVAVLVAAHVVSGISYDDWLSLLLATLVLGMLNAVLRPILILLSLPLVLFSLGLFMIVINAVLLHLVGWLFSSFHVASFGSALVGSLVISLVTLFLNALTGTGGARIQVRRARSRRRRPPDDSGQGPVIDV